MRLELGLEGKWEFTRQRTEGKMRQAGDNIMTAEKHKMHMISAHCPSEHGSNLNAGHNREL